MSMTDPIADLLTRIRNGNQARKERVDVPWSRTKEAIVRVLVAMAQAIVVGHARRRHHIGGVLAGAKRHGKTDQRSRQAEGAPRIGGLF